MVGNMVAYSVCSVACAGPSSSVSRPAVPAASSQSRCHQHHQLTSVCSLCRRLHDQSTSLRRQVLDAFDTAHERLRHRQQQLLRIIDAAAAQRINTLWDRCVSDLDRHSHSDALPSVDVQLNWECLSQCVENFCSVQITGLSDTASTGSAQPFVMEDYGAEDHLVMHKPLPVDPTHVHITVPRALPEVCNDGQSSDSFDVVTSPLPSLASLASDDSKAVMLTSDEPERDPTPVCAAPALPPHPLANVKSAWLHPKSQTQVTSSCCASVSALSSDFEMISVAASLSSRAATSFVIDKSKWLMSRSQTESTDGHTHSSQAPPTLPVDQSYPSLFAPFYKQAASVEWIIKRELSPDT